ncbi:hypothetical protein Q765_00350 [Flavobacterium rivuli WB 3.3-2 = DSM 21788]|uniref:Uncharacterized protein n=1 Tax=Flavobacterium rivuli WB 3.3-2 = DSM 21788 TaxID=1121895 RepID=A0A0A2M6W7_9FLAO|nr:hypothetical protein [Flavobacterium rivuli]KGO88402.1 hypothetical protein Q765_00350 [Flavobacterium rivuli WB 3.3-2 = DSM 21788]
MTPYEEKVLELLSGINDKLLSISVQFKDLDKKTDSLQAKIEDISNNTNVVATHYEEQKG